MTISDLNGTLGLDDRIDGHLDARVDPLVVRFVRERGQDWVEVAPAGTPVPAFYSFHDLEIAFGWRTVEDVLGLNDVEPLEDVLRRVVQHWDELRTNLAHPGSAGWARVAHAASSRGEAFAARLR
jgi:hypothetical protein